jgi:RHS repeat-associated protein
VDTFRQKFTGQERDNESYLDFFQARYFSGIQGRFTSPDPGNAGADPADPQSWNGYGYVSGNPLDFTDPSGLVAQAGGGGDGGSGGGIINFIVHGIEAAIQGIFGGGASNPNRPQGHLSSIAWTESQQSYAMTGLTFSADAYCVGCLPVVPHHINWSAAAQRGSARLRRHGQVHPQSSGRSADFYNVTVSRDWVGSEVSVSLDRTGRVYLGFGGQVGKSPSFYGASVTGNWLDQYRAPTAAELDNYLSAWNVTGTAAYGPAVAQGGWPGSGLATGLGFGTPQIGVGATYSWQILHLPIGWH